MSEDVGRVVAAAMQGTDRALPPWLQEAGGFAAGCAARADSLERTLQGPEEPGAFLLEELESARTNATRAQADLDVLAHAYLAECALQGAR